MRSLRNGIGVSATAGGLALMLAFAPRAGALASSGAVAPVASSVTAAAIRPTGGAVTRPTIGITVPPWTGPTADITTVGDQLSYQAKSVTVVVSAPAGLAVTKPVTISVDYGGDVSTQTYSPSTGLRIVYNYAPGDELPHVRNVTITLTQPNPAGGYYSANIHWNPLITPLYDVAISHLTLTLVSDCEVFGANNIIFAWTDPADDRGRIQLKMEFGDHVVIPQFRSNWDQVSAATELVQPSIYIQDTGPGFSFDPGAVPSSVSLMPGHTTSYVTHMDVDDEDPGEQVLTGGLGGCSALVEYTQTYTVDTFPNL